MQWIADGEDRALNEYLFLSALERRRRSPDGQRAAYFHLSRLKAGSGRSAQRAHLAASTVAKLLDAGGGQVFPLGNSDLAFLGPLQAVNQAVAQLCQIFRDDPLMAAKERCIYLFDLETHYERLLTLARRLFETARRRLKSQARSAAAAPPAFGPAGLGQLKRQLRAVDMASLIERQPVCRRESGDGWRPVFEELYVSVEALRERLAPQADLRASTWLFRALTEALDTETLHALSRRHRALDLGAFSLNLNLGSLATPEFQAFHEMMSGQARHVILELNAVDVMANMKRFVQIRDLVRRAGYRLCIDGLTWHSLAVFDLERLDADLYKVAWAADLSKAGPLADLERTVTRLGQPRLVMSHCDHPQALTAGAAAGVGLYQGKLIEELAGSPAAHGLAA